MRAFTTASISLCVFAFISLVLAAPAPDGYDYKKFDSKPAEYKGKRYYTDEYGKEKDCQYFLTGSSPAPSDDSIKPSLDINPSFNITGLASIVIAGLIAGLLSFFLIEEYFKQKERKMDEQRRNDREREEREAEQRAVEQREQRDRVDQERERDRDLIVQGVLAGLEGLIKKMPTQSV